MPGGDMQDPAERHAAQALGHAGRRGQPAEPVDDRRVGRVAPGPAVLAAHLVKPPPAASMPTMPGYWGSIFENKASGPLPWLANSSEECGNAQTG